MLMVTNPLLNKLRKVVKGKLPNPKTINEKLLMPFCRRVFTLVTKDERAAVEAGGDFPELPVQDWWAQWPECHPVRIPAEAAAEAPAKKKRGTKHVLQGQPRILARPFGERRTSRRSSLR